MIFRLKAVIPLIIILALLGYGVYAFRNLIVKKAMEHSWPHVMNTRLITDDVDLKLGESSGLSFSGKIVEVGKRKVRLGWESASVIVHTTPLGYGYLMVDSVTLEGLEAKRNLFKDEEKALEENLKEEAAAEEAGKKVLEKIPGLDVKDIDARDVLKRLTGNEKLQSEIKYEILKKNVDATIEKWKNIDNQVKSKKEKLKGLSKELEDKYKNPKEFLMKGNELSGLRQQVNSLKGAKVNSIEQVADLYLKVEQVRQNAKNFKNGLQSMRNTIETDINTLKQVQADVNHIVGLPKELEQDIKRIRNDAEEVRKAAKSDMEMLKKELDIGDFGVGKVTRLLFGEVWEKKIESYLEMWDRVKGYLPKLKVFDDKFDPSKQYMGVDDRPIAYPRDWVYPDWSVAHVKVSGKAEEIDKALGEVNFQAEVFDLSSNEAKLGKPVTWKAKGRLGEDKGHFTLQGMHTGMENIRADRGFEFELKGYRLKEQPFGPSRVRVIIREGVMGVRFKANLAKTPTVLINGEVLLDQLKIGIGEKVKKHIQEPLRSAVASALKKPIEFSILHRPDHSPKIRLKSDLDNILKDTLRGFVANKMKSEQEKIVAKFNKKIQDQLMSQIGDNGALKFLNEGMARQFGQDAKFLNNSFGSLNNLLLGRKNHVTNIDDLAGAALKDVLGIQNNRGSLEAGIRDRLKKEAERKVKEKLEREAKKKLLDKLGGQSGQQQGDAKELIKKEVESKVLDQLKKFKF